ncbi:unnamed protein product, partial [Phaeothamnion confervicola]
RFFVREWLPQAAIIADPRIKAVVTHCGMGGLCECLEHAKPILALPFAISADQPFNAAAVADAGVGIWLRP